jgi:hypothetical protein
MGSLVCGISSTDFNLITNAQIEYLINFNFVHFNSFYFKNFIQKRTNYPTLKKIQNSVCPSISTLYSRIKSINGITSLESSNVADMDGIAGGASISDINSMSTEVWLSFSSTAIKNMPAETVNALPVSILKLTTTTQLSAFYTSPYYSSYSNSIQTYLTQLSNGQTISTASESDMNKFNLISLISTILMALIFIININ